MTAPEQPTPTAAAIALAERYVDAVSEVWGLALAIDELAAQRAAEAVEAPPDDALLHMTEHNVTVAAAAYCWSRNSLGRHDSALLHILEDTLAERDRVSQQPITDAATPPPGDAAVIVGNFTIDKLRRGETVEVNGIALIPADDLRDPPGDAGARAREIIAMAVNVAANVAPNTLLLHWRVDRELVKGITAALQSERTAAASQVRREAIKVAERSERNHVTAGDLRGATVAHNIARNIAAIAPPQESA